MPVTSAAPVSSPPDWVVAQMPPGYKTRLDEIERLSAELRGMDRFARLLWDVGAALEQGVRDVFQSLKLDVDVVPSDSGAQLIVKLDGRRRLLVCVSDTEDALTKKSLVLEHAFQMLQMSGDDDKVILIANADRWKPPADRSAPLTADALTLVQRLGVNFVPAPYLFTLWSVALQEPARARKYLDQLHAQNGGIVGPPTI